MRLKDSIMFAACFIFLAACSKSSSEGIKPVPALTSKWNYVAQYYSIGGPGSWYAVSPVTQWIDLQANGVVSSNLEPFKSATGYEIPEANKIKFIIPSKPDGYSLFQYRIDSTEASLVLSPLNPICIEGCALKFKP